MMSDDFDYGELKDSVIRICPACGVVNPSGPSRTCAHLQLARFEGPDAALLELLGEVAEARVRFMEVSGRLSRAVHDAISKGEAEVIVTRKGRVSDIERLERPDRAPRALELESPPAQKPPRPAKPRKRPPPTPPPVDPRQLELLAHTAPKGDA